MISSSPAKKPLAGSIELGGSLFNSTNWLEFFGPGRDELTLLLVVELLVLVELVGLVLLEEALLELDGEEED